ncbi:MAG TPA: phage holin family protein [Candidatus Limnocylindria bacterium]|nr:phage holin family protein [Candidatus Limnocylindria bacterium]
MQRPGYRTLVGRVRSNVRSLIARHIELPKQEIAEIVRANLNAVKWFAIAAVLALLFLIAFVVFVIALLAIWLPLPLAALVAMLIFGLIAAFFGWGGRKRLQLRGPTRSIDTFKETVQWAKTRLLGRRPT